MLRHVGFTILLAGPAARCLSLNAVGQRLTPASFDFLSLSLQNHFYSFEKKSHKIYIYTDIAFIHGERSAVGALSLSLSLFSRIYHRISLPRFSLSPFADERSLWLLIDWSLDIFEEWERERESSLSISSLERREKEDGGVRVDAGGMRGGTVTVVKEENLSEA